MVLVAFVPLGEKTLLKVVSHWYISVNAQACPNPFVYNIYPKGIHQCVLKYFGLKPKDDSDALHWRQNPSIVCVCPQLSSFRVNKILWVILKQGSEVYAFQPSEQEKVPVKQCSLMCGINDNMEQFDGTCTAKASKVPLSVITNTHFSLSCQAPSPNLLPMLSLGVLIGSPLCTYFTT